jgi:hypothetical protein
MRALLAKDLRLHGRDAAFAAGGAFLLIEMANRLVDQGPGPRGSFVFNINLLLTLLWSEWLITRERSKRTFAWLRGLPVDDRVLVSSKFVAGAGCAVAFWILSSALFARELWQPVGTGLVLLCALLSFGGLSIAAKWRFPWKVGHFLPLLVILVPLLILMKLAGDGSVAQERLVALWNAPAGRPAVAATLLLVYAAIVTVTVRWVSGADTSQLVD